MRHRVIHIVGFVLLMLSAWKGYGQTSAPDTVCLGSTKNYWVNPTPGSTYQWRLDGILQPGSSNSISITWNTLGDFMLTVVETSGDLCPGDTIALPVHVKNEPPDFNVPPLENGYCVENISEAIYNPAGSYPNKTDLIPPRPDYYLVTYGSTMLDITGITDDCTLNPDISWIIDFAGPAPPDNLAGTGQISAAIPPEGIRFPVGDNVITWTVTDGGGLSVTKTVHLIVFPRPEIGDIPP